MDSNISRKVDYWHRRGSLLSLNGILIMIVTILSVAWIDNDLLRTHRLEPGSVPMRSLTIIHVWIQTFFLGLISLLMLQFLLSKGIAGLGLAFCPR